MPFFDWLLAPWPWWISGPLIGLVVPMMLIIGNKPFGVSSSLRHVCAALAPSKIPFFRYDWRKESWNLLFVAGIVLGAMVTALWLTDSRPIELDATLVNDLRQNKIENSGLLPVEVFSWKNLFTLQGFLVIILGGFLIGFGTRYADGCTSGHSISGLSNFQWPSLVATICFMVGGILTANFLVPVILKL